MTEDQEQQNVIKWSQQPTIRKAYPELAMLYHIPNERKCSVQEGARLKRMGVKRGVPDLCLPIPRGKYHGLYIEMKTETGRPTPEQKWWGEKLTGAGYFWEVCHGWQIAVRVLEWYLTT